MAKDLSIYIYGRGLRFSDGVMCLSWWTCENCALAQVICKFFRIWFLLFIIILNGSNFFRPFNMTWMLSHFSFAQKWKFAFIGAKLRIFIVDTSLLNEKVFKSAGFLQWFCLRSILYCYSQWICMVAQIRRSDSQVFFEFRLRFSDGVMCLSWWACENCALA